MNCPRFEADALDSAVDSVASSDHGKANPVGRVGDMGGPNYRLIETTPTA